MSSMHPKNHARGFDPTRIDLPIVEILPALRDTLATFGVVVLEAAPGAGKSSVVPLALMDEPWLGRQRIIMLEPRRIAARAVTERMAGLLGEAVGQTVGYRMRVESRVGPTTRIEVVTEGVLTRMLQDDPSLDGVGLVVFDEFHERSLQADLGLAFTLQAQQMLREDLRVLIMSATLEGLPLAERLQAQVVKSAGRLHPVEVHYRPPQRDFSLEGHAAAMVRRALAEEHGDILVFLPGKREIQRVAAGLRELAEVDVLPLHGDMSLAEQHAVLEPRHERRRVILATNIAETSLTIEGVRVVVDSGLARVSRFDPASGMTRLVTQHISKANAEQRCGRAGRLGPGVCIRLWGEGEQGSLPAQAEPEIQRADLLPLALELAQWGAHPEELFWLDPPPAALLDQAREVLQGLGAVDAGGHMTPHGRELARMPLHPRLAHMLVEGNRLGYGRLACELAALLGERDLLRGAGCERLPADLVLRIEALRWGSAALPAGLTLDEGARARVRQSARDLARRMGIELVGAAGDVHAVGLLVALAYPERVAQGRMGQPGRFVLANGRGALLDAVDALAHAPWLAIAHLDGHTDGVRREARVFLAAGLTLNDIEEAFAARIEDVEEVTWDGREQAVMARRQRRLGALVLEDRPLPKPDPERVRTALLEGICQVGLACLPWQARHQQWRGRVTLLRRTLGEGWPDVSDAALLASLDDWLVPRLDGMTRLSHLERLDLDAALQSLLPWDKRQEFDRLAPTHLEVPSGSRIALDYSPVLEGGGLPVLAVKLQELFGLLETPRIAQGRVPVMIHMLSPAQRPVAVTQDLASFWRGPYQDVRKDLRGRYPKHPWPEDPLTATPTRRTKRVEG
ncbi:MAG: ATP-dependent helicase HrpB [Gammaproteobacteria bacterium]|nr:ATP-dependent helicase HrpB [Gammaproteobacteria bacterium]